MNNSLISQLSRADNGCKCVLQCETDRELLLENRRLKAVTEKTRDLAHDLNNLLQVVAGNSQLALISLRSERFHQVAPILERIVRSAMQGAKDLSHLQNLVSCGTRPIVEQESLVDLAPLVKDSVALTTACLKVDFPDSKPAILVKTYISPGCFVKGNKGAIFNMLINLLRNALEAMREGGEMIVSTYIDGQAVFTEIRDSGQGIRSKDLDKIFQHSWSTKRSGSRGIGMHNVSNIIREHGGHISVDSREKKGTCVTVMLPLYEKLGMEAMVP